MTDGPRPTGGDPAPRLSLVTVLQREQAYVGDLVRSVLAQPAAAFEVVAVDDAATGHGTELLGELAAADPRVRVERLDARHGIGRARAAGLRAAAGEHVWFLQPTSLVAPGALAAVVARLDATGADVVLLAHERQDRLGTRRPGPHNELAAQLARDGFAGRVAERPGLAATGAAVWDKVLRRDLVARPQATGPGLVWPALLDARRIAALDTTAFVHRKSGFPAGDDERPRAIADQYAGVLATLEPGSREHALVLGDATRQALALMEGAAAARRPEVFAAFSAVLRANGGAAAVSGPFAVLRARLLEQGAYTPYRLIERGLDGRRRLGRAERAARRRAGQVNAARRRRTTERHYAQRRREPVDPQLAVFAAYWYRGYSCNPKAIYEKARELVPGMRGVWVVHRKWAGTMPAGVEHVVSGTPEYWDVIARAGVLVNNVNFPNHLVKREGSVHVMTHHGTPLKRMGLELRDAPVAGQRIDFPAMLRRAERWDYSVSSNRLSTLVWERAFPTGHETLEVGYPRNDALVDATDDDVRGIRARLGIEDGQVAVLYAPTHREWHTRYVPVLDLTAVAGRLEADHVLLARSHYFYDTDPSLRALRRDGRIIDVSAHPSVEELCLAADVLVTDYSSIMFDYAVLDRPIVVHAPDWDVYRALRGTYFDLLEEPPGVVTRTEEEVVDALVGGAARGPEADALRAAFRARFCALDDGHAAERVVRRVWLGEPVPAPGAVAAVAS